MDRVFHRALAAATQNRLMAATIVQLHNNSSRFWYFSLPRLDPAVVRADIATHLKVVQAVRRRDPAAAMQQMRAVLGHFPEDVHVFFSQQLQSHKEVPAHEQHRVRRWVGKRPEKGARAASRLS
jgi:DNA-binding FadR family transcriptional regulator